ncbi:hypothetical protein AVEN_78559-1 [Araneus ventricosus]|uniref:Uncharacterized protein n=1 Tax=Araneus ventricosus TaxID=182803 RepID=A0A4Y2LD91_ARAVE|nr:hypothetical protein AVEN_78559-1 [Araneus ventricosus]
MSHSAALQSVETLLDYMGQRGLDYGDIPAVRKICADIRKEMNKEQKQRRITDFFKAANVKRKNHSLMLYSMQITSPEVPLFKRFKEYWRFIETAQYETGISIDVVSELIKGYKKDTVERSASNSLAAN